MLLTPEEDQLLCRVEGRAPMGQLMRRHWIPACLSEQVPEPDGAPAPVRVLGENLVVWRDSDGRVGLMDRQCPHRRASLVLARNEQRGLRCLYHGWKLDVEGRVLEMPSEPPESALLEKARHPAYPTHEHGGFVWAYMGPRGSMPAFEAPAFAPTAKAKVSVIAIQVEANWAQVLEGALDSAHSSTLHSSNIVPARSASTTRQGERYGRPSDDKAPRIQIQPTGYGFKYAALRRPIVDAATHEYVRTTLYVAPFTALIPPNDRYGISIVSVPVDDTHAMFYLIAWTDPAAGVDLPGIAQEDWRRQGGAQVGVDVDGRYRKIRTLENNYLQDREAMKNGDFTGIRGVPNQDVAMVESMGPIVDRTRERLGASDQAIIEFRRTMVEAARRFADGGPVIGTREFAAHAQKPYVQQALLRAFEGILPKDTEWRVLDTAGAQRAPSQSSRPAPSR
jgi:phthalate 4,5-dioxygenase oxygenase subunit